MHRASLAPLFAFALLLAAPHARADEDPPEGPRVIRVDQAHPVPEEPRERVWYGWQILLADAGALAVAGIAQGAHAPPLGFAASGGYGAAAPVVHFLHGHVDKGMASLGLRIGAPLLLGIAAYAVAPAPRDDGARSLGMDSRTFAAAMGATLGMGAAIALDAGVIAREDAPIASGDGFSVAPTAAPVRGGAAVGVTGTF
jgi:hypothetical protein